MITVTKKNTICFLVLFSYQLLYSQVPTITNLSPTSGAVGTAVTITGTNFSSTIVNNIVWFGGVKATVTSATATSLTATVPVGATHSPIRVLVNGLIAESSKPFSITFNGGDISATSLSAKLDFATGSTPRGIALSDLDGDGKIDMAVTNSTVTSNSISVYRNISSSGTITSGSFSTKVDFATGTTPWGIALGDIDGDGKTAMEFIVAFVTKESIPIDASYSKEFISLYEYSNWLSKIPLDSRCSASAIVNIVKK